MKRPKIQESRIDYILDTVNKRVKLLWQKRKNATWVSPQEALGVITEEYHELIEAIHRNERTEEFAELLDLATASIYAMASQEYMTRFEEDEMDLNTPKPNIKPLAQRPIKRGPEG